MGAPSPYFPWLPRPWCVIQAGEEYGMRLGQLFKAYRQIHDLTVTQLAGQMGVSPGVLTRLEKGDEIRSKQMAAVLLWCLTGNLSQAEAYMAAATVLTEERAAAKEPGIWWCWSHSREATDVLRDGRRRCNPLLGGIMLACNVERLAQVPDVEREAAPAAE